MNKDILIDIRNKFEQFECKQKPIIIKSPGRINIIGEHTDYNKGFVLPAAIDKAIYIAISDSGSKTCHLISTDFDDEATFDIDKIEKHEKHWVNYVIGVVDQLNIRKFEVKGFNAIISGDIPTGAGLSSSAALECGFAFALNHLNNLNITKKELARIGQGAEHKYAGVQCGIMDQYASVHGKSGNVMRLDCRSVEHEYFPLNLEDNQLILLDTNVKHSLASTAYNTRRNECEEGVAILQKYYSDVKVLRDVDEEMLARHRSEFSENVYDRCEYVVNENDRVSQVCQALEKGDLNLVGKLMYSCHDGLQHKYSVSCKELDFLVDYTRNNSDVLGARMMGGGFGGCTINLVKNSGVEQFINNIGPAYKQAMGKDLTVHQVDIADGTQIVEYAYA